MAKNPYTDYSYKNPKKVSVIASFDAEGKIRPLYVRIGSESYKIATFWEKSRFINVTEFHCQIVDGDTLKPVVLTFYREDGFWGITTG